MSHTNDIGPYTWTLNIWKAVELNQVQRVKQLIDQGEDVNKVDRDVCE